MKAIEVNPIRLRIGILQEAYEHSYGPPFDLVSIDALARSLKAHRSEVTFQISYLEEDRFLERIGWAMPAGYRLTDRGAEWLEREGDRMLQRLDAREQDPLLEEDLSSEEI